MEDLHLDIPEFVKPDDFTIIYKGKKDENEGDEEGIIEIKTSKEEFLRKLRYFKNKTSEINETNELFIHDIFPIKAFKEFIDTLKSKKIRVNENNYSLYHKMSIKYEYYELKQLIESYLENRPDIVNIIDNFQIDEIDYKKEESISEHLDICLRNQTMPTFPIPILIRILNSPKRKINDHHLLFSFIKKVIVNYESSETNEDIESKNQNIQLLLASLNYLKMSNDDLEELFNSKHFTNAFNNKGTKEIMKNLINDKKDAEKRISQLEDLIESQQRKHSSEIDNLIQKQKEMFENQQQKHSNEIGNLIQKQKDLIENQQQKYSNEIENLIQKQKEMFENQQRKHSSEIEDLIQKQKEMFDQINELNQKFEKEKEKKKLKGSINIGLIENQKIGGEILIEENETKLDTSRSKYILNNSSSTPIGINSYNEGYSIESVKQKFSFIKPSGTYYLHALLVNIFGDSKEIVSQPVTTKGVNIEFVYTGEVQSVTLDPGKYKLEVWGAEGGKNESSNYIGKSGKGGYSVGTLSLKKRTTMYVCVGESPTSKSGGWNGGGSGTSFAAGGGGATDISLFGTEGSSDWNTQNHLFSRIIVAGAGGGSGKDDYYKGIAGFGGGINGGDSEWGPKENGGSQTRAGLNTRNSTGQKFGVGGSFTGPSSSGGGGGWYGGGASNNAGSSTGGAGGSGYVYNSSTASNYPSGCLLNSDFYLENSSMIGGNESFPSPSVLPEVGHSGNGYAKITPL